MLQFMRTCGENGNDITSHRKYLVYIIEDSNNHWKKDVYYPILKK